MNYTKKEMVGIIKEWFARTDVKDRKSELEEPMRKLWNDLFGENFYIARNDEDGLVQLFGLTAYPKDVLDACVKGNWKETHTYIMYAPIELRCDTDYKLVGYDNLYDYPEFIDKLALILSGWEKERVDKIFRLNMWEFETAPSRYIQIEEWDLRVYKNSSDKSANVVHIREESWRNGNEIEFRATIKGCNAFGEKESLVIYYQPTVDDVLNLMGYDETRFKRR